MSVEFSIVRLREDLKFTDFDCGDEDLNSFLLNDSKSFLKRLLSVTYLLYHEQDIVGYFSLSNDKISLSETSKSSWRKVKKLFPHAKHRSDYPAVKIGRLAISKEYQHKEIGTSIIDLIKSLFYSNNRAGCAFVTVDALQSAVPFYLKNGFCPLDQSSSIHADTQTLYYDLKRLSE